MAETIAHFLHEAAPHVLMSPKPIKGLAYTFEPGRRASLDESGEIKPTMRKLVEDEFKRGASIPVEFFPVCRQSLGTKRPGASESCLSHRRSTAEDLHR